MTAVAPGTADPCPSCGSLNVRWRRRRLYDIVFTYLRYLLDAAFGGGEQTTTLDSAYSPEGIKDRLRAAQYREERGTYEARVGTTTASSFWKCPECGQRGQIFDTLDHLLTERKRLVQTEEQIDENLGAVTHGLGPDAPPDD